MSNQNENLGVRQDQVGTSVQTTDHVLTENASLIKETDSGLIIRYGNVSVDKVEQHAYKDKLYTAQLRQIVSKEYPATKAGNSESDSLFAVEDFNFDKGQTFSSSRVAFMDVPVDTTADQVSTKLSNASDCCLYRKISYNVEDVMTSEQKWAVTSGTRSIEEFQESLIVRRKNDDGVIEDIEGDPQYKQTFFSLKYRDDEDFRNTDVS